MFKKSNTDIDFNIYKDEMWRYVIVTFLAWVKKEDINIKVHWKTILFTVKRDTTETIFWKDTKKIEKLSWVLNLNWVFKWDVKLPIEVEPKNVVSKFVDWILIVTVSDSIAIHDESITIW